MRIYLVDSLALSPNQLWNMIKDALHIVFSRPIKMETPDAGPEMPAMYGALSGTLHIESAQLSIGERLLAQDLKRLRRERQRALTPIGQ